MSWHNSAVAFEHAGFKMGNNFFFPDFDQFDSGTGCDSSTISTSFPREYLVYKNKMYPSQLCIQVFLMLAPSRVLFRTIIKYEHIPAKYLLCNGIFKIEYKELQQY